MNVWESFLIVLIWRGESARRSPHIHSLLISAHRSEEGTAAPCPYRRRHEWLRFREEGAFPCVLRDAAR